MSVYRLERVEADAPARNKSLSTAGTRGWRRRAFSPCRRAAGPLGGETAIPSLRSGQP